MLLAESVQKQREVLEFANVPAGWLLFLWIAVVAGACTLVLWLYRRERRAGASRMLRSSLAAIRCFVLVGLATIWLRPVIATFDVRSITARVIVLTDVSASMLVADAAEEHPGRNPTAAGATPSRLARVQQLFSRDDFSWLRRLAERNDLALLAFGERTAPIEIPFKPGAPQVPSSQPESAPPDEPRLTISGMSEPNALRSRTDLGAALAHVAEEAAGGPLAAVILISDGQLNSGLGTEDVTALARRLKAPIVAVAAGRAEEPPNLRVTSVSAPASVPRGDPFELRVEVAANGIEPQEAQLAVTFAPTGGEDVDEKVIERRKVQLGGEIQPVPLLISINPPAAGEYVFRARLEPLENEAILQDNVRETTVQVLEDRLRVLMVSGRPSYDYRFVERLLERDKTIDVSCWLQSADEKAIREGDTPLTELPSKPEELFAYDCILLLDPNPTDLTASWAALVRRFVDELGGGLLLESGAQFTSRFMRDPKLQDITNVLPITPDPDADVHLSDQGTYRTRAVTMELPPEVRAHPLLNFATEPNVNVDIWRALSGPMWYLPVLRPKPLAAVLLRPAGAAPKASGGASGSVLFAAQPFGSGRTAFLAFDSTWRWRGTAENYFNRFWVQLVRYLSQARRESISKRGTITIDRDNVNVGDYIKIEARVLDPSFAPSAEPAIEATFSLGDATRTIPMSAIPGREGWFVGNVLIDRDGQAAVRIPLPQDPLHPATQPSETSLVKRFRVQQPDIEMRALRRRDDVLKLLAEQTGGRYVPLAEAQSVPDQIERAAQERITPGPARDLWDRAWVLSVLAALLALEWTLRRRNHLL